jgi:hypothetical protein
MTSEVPPPDSVEPEDRELAPTDADPQTGDPELEDGDLDNPEASVATLRAPFVEPKASQRTSAPTRRTATLDSSARPGSSEEDVPYIDDRVSKYWVGAIAATFLLILLYGLLFGHAGMFSPPPPTDVPIPTDAPTLSLSPTVTPPISPTVAPSEAPSLPSVAPTLTPATPTSVSAGST